jgi:hypothetical protein
MQYAMMMEAAKQEQEQAAKQETRTKEGKLKKG